MPRPFGGAGIELSTRADAERIPADPEAPFRIAIFGDFSGRANRGISEPGSPAERRPIETGRDNFDSVMAQIGPALSLPFGGETELRFSIAFKELGDFHPDRIYERFEIFQKLKDPPLADAISAEMRGLLHQPDFQALEAAWRGAFFLARKLDPAVGIRLYLVDATKADLAESADLSKVLLETGESWALVGGDYTFGPTREDAELLRHMAGIACRAGAPFLAAASPHLVGWGSLAESSTPERWRCEWDAEAEQAWDSLRRMPEASYLGLALPRFLLRPPYGPGINTVDQFDFEEMPAGSPPHELYLWANPMFACVFLLATAFGEYRWQLRPGICQEIEDMPAHFYAESGDIRMKPCAEAMLTADAAEKILDGGVMPLLSVKGRDAVRLARFQSLRKPAAPLSGRWA
jgi:type VI secretion system protein ImpC